MKRKYEPDLEPTLRFQYGVTDDGEVALAINDVKLTMSTDLALGLAAGLRRQVEEIERRKT